VRAFPFGRDVTDFIAEHERVFLVEQNRDAQLRTLLLAECGIDPAALTPILHYDGTPITARFIHEAIAGALKAVPETVRVASSELRNSE
jgi:2-oxoglutarate ferredoxin oxidoreductase subunit alpha